MKLIGSCLASLFAFLALAPSVVAQGPEITIEQPAGVPLEMGSVVAWGLNDNHQAGVPALAGVKAVAAGAGHTVVVKSNGTVEGWGAFTDGQLNVPDGLTGVVAVAAGSAHTVALKGDGTVVAWGSDYWGQKTVPAGLTGVTAIEACNSHSVALKSDGTVVAWGRNDYGQTDVPAGLTGVTAIAAGSHYSVALKEDGTVVTWGSNAYGQTTVPVGLTGVTAIAAGLFHTMAVKSDGTVVAWGRNDEGQTNVPVGLTGVTAIAAGFHYSVALKSDGTMVDWGGNGTGLTTVPTGLTGVKAIAAGYSHIVVLKDPVVDFGAKSIGTTGAVKTFTIKNTGYDVLDISSVSVVGGDVSDFTVNTGGMLGSAPADTGRTTFTVSFAPGALGYRRTTLRVMNSDQDEGTYDITLSGMGTPPAPEIVIEQPAGTPDAGTPFEKGAVFGWGSNAEGQLTMPEGLTNVVALSAGLDYTVALKGDGKVVAWGKNDEGQTDVPVGLKDVVAIAAGVAHTVALRRDGTVVAWGRTTDGQTNVPAGLKGVIAVAAGKNHTMALKNDGRVATWGEFYLIGPAGVPGGLTDVVAIAAGVTHGVVLSGNGAVISWENGIFLGSGSIRVSYPGGVGGVSAIASGGKHIVALKVDGTVAAWGADYFGESTPPEGLTDVVAITASSFRTLALKRDGTVVAWGRDDADQAVPEGLAGVRAISAGGSHTVGLKDPSVAFGGQPRGITSGARAFTIRNTGSTPLGISSVSVIGGDASDFTVDTRGMLASVPRLTGETEFTVTFTPGAAGPRRTTLRVINDDSDEGSYDIVLTGTGVLIPEIAIEQAGSMGTVVEWGDETLPPGLKGLKGLKSIATGHDHVLALKSDGTTVGWGGPNHWGQASVPVGLTDVMAFATGYHHNLALKSNGTVVAWGENSIGQTTIPPGLMGVIAIEAGPNHSVALKSDGSVVAWGWNDRGQTNVPVGLAGVVAISAGRDYTLALKGDGTVVAWGGNDWGQVNVPGGLTGVTAISAGYYHALALKSDGTVMAWGANEEGQTNVPAGLTGVTAISASGGHCVALKSNGTVVAWGKNLQGQTSVPVGLVNVRAIAAGSKFSVALTDFSGFTPQIVTTPSAPQTYTIRNTGAGELHVSSVNVVGGDSSDFTVNTRGLLATVPANTGETTFTVTFTPSAPGLRQATLRVVNSDSDEGSYDIVLTGTGVTAPPLETWRQLHFGTTASAGIAADNADANGNGIVNLLEYALGGDPKGRTTGLGILPQLSVSPFGSQEISFIYDPGRTGITLTVQANDGLMGSWTDLARSVNGAPFTVITSGVVLYEAPFDTLRFVAVGDLYELGDPAHPTRFMRLQVTRP